MKQEFITSLGKVEKIRDVLFIKNLDFHFHHTLLYELFLPLGWIFLTVIRTLTAENNLDYIQALITSILSILHGFPLYDVVFKRSFSNRIPLNRINSTEIKKGPSGLETLVILHLQSGRYKKIRFRTMEMQHEAFLESISTYLAVPEAA